VADAGLPAPVHGLLLGGGYPELQAGRLAGNASMRAAIAAAVRSGLPTYAECGGFMYLVEHLVVGDQVHPMLGILPGRTVVESRLQALGYREVSAGPDNPFLAAGQRARGHEFRYSRYQGPAAVTAAWTVRDREGRVTGAAGLAGPNLVASYIHLHWLSNPDLATNFVQACRSYRSGARAPRPQRTGLVIVYTGEGKGKTSAAMGTALRAAGHGLRVLVVQFIKGRVRSGELRRLGELSGVEVVSGGLGTTRGAEAEAGLEPHLEAIGGTWRLVRERALSGQVDLVVLDEVNYVLSNARLRAALPVAEVIEFLRDRPPGLHVVLTGRNAPPEVVEAADIVTELKPIKHCLGRGVRAQAGIEY
jgi:cob(I)alamin adenosyltransferase